MIVRIWEIDPDMQLIFCSAYSDHNWNEIRKRIGETGQLASRTLPAQPGLQLGFGIEADGRSLCWR